MFKTKTPSRIAAAIVALAAFYAVFQLGRHMAQLREDANQYRFMAAACRVQLDSLERRLAFAEREIMARDQFVYRVAAGHYSYVPAIASIMGTMRGIVKHAATYHSDSALRMAPHQIDSALRADPRTKYINQR